MTEAEQRKAERRAAMPITSAFWSAIVAEFGTPEYFHAKENGRSITFPAPVKGRQLEESK